MRRTPSPTRAKADTATSQAHSRVLGARGVTRSACHPGKAGEVGTPTSHEGASGRAQLAAEGLLRRGPVVHRAVEADQSVSAVLAGEEPAGQPGLLVRRPQARG